MIKIMEDGAAKAKFNGSPVFSYGLYSGKILKSETLHASKDKLICGITIRQTYGGSTSNARLTYTFQRFSNGKIKATIGDR